jgi:hypothetical protein
VNFGTKSSGLPQRRNGYRFGMICSAGSPRRRAREAAAPASVDTQHDAALPREIQCPRLIEMMTGDVKDRVLPRRLSPLESMEVVRLSRNQRGDLAGAGFDPAAVGGNSEHRLSAAACA